MNQRQLEVHIRALALAFAEGVARAVIAVPVGELESTFELTAPSRARRTSRTQHAEEAAKVRSGKVAEGGSKRRSREDIAALAARIVALVKQHADGLRAEHIREELGVAAAELPLALKHALSEGTLKAKGQKRATVYRAGK